MNRKENHMRSSKLLTGIKKHWALYLLLVPIMGYYAIFRYWPILNSIMLATRTYKMKLGIWGSPYAGLSNFQEMFRNPEIINILSNTIEISLMRIIFGFIPPILLAIIFYDMTSIRYKKACQTIVYIPYFFSWIVVYGIVLGIFSEGMGLVNNVATMFGADKINYLMSKTAFRPILIGSAIWKEIGWGTIIYMAALSGIDAEQYEAATMDGAGPLRRIYYISIPGLLPVISFVLCLSLGNILYAGGEQILAFYNSSVYNIADVVDTWIYRVGIGNMKISLAAAVGLFQSVFGMVTIIIANKILVKTVGTGIW